MISTESRTKLEDPTRVGHDVVCDNLHGVQRPELAAVHAVAPSGVVLSVGVRLHGKNGKKAARQKQKLRQKAHAARPVAAGKGYAVRVSKNGDRGGQQQNQHPIVAQAAGDCSGVEPCMARYATQNTKRRLRLGRTAETRTL